MKLEIGTIIEYTSAAGVRLAKIVNMHIGPTAKPGHLTTWLTLEIIPVSKGKKATSRVQIPGGSDALKMFKVTAV